MRERVSCSIENHVALVTLDRADKHNALDMPMFEALSEVGDQLAGDSSIRAVVLTGAGKNFCAGIDVSLFAAATPQAMMQAMEPAGTSPANLFQRAAYVWREVPVPVICAVNGVAFGGGLQVALGADLRIAHPDARFSIMEIQWGLIPDMAITTTLARYLQADRLKELAWTGRKFDGREALELGVVSALREDPLQAANELASRIVARSPDAVRAIKQLFDAAWSLPPRDALALEARLQREILGRPNQVEAVKANVEGRAPRFANPEPGDR